MNWHGKMVQGSLGPGKEVFVWVEFMYESPLAPTYINNLISVP